MLILDLWGISFHAVVVFAMGKNLLFKSALGHCDQRNGHTQKRRDFEKLQFFEMIKVTVTYKSCQIGKIGILQTCQFL